MSELEKSLKKEVVLETQLRQFNRVLVAFSGGIDSTVVLNTALKVVGQENVVAVVANSALFSNDEYDKAMALAEKLGAKVVGTELDYLAQDDIKNNTPASWYWMKKLFYQRMNELKAQYEADVVLDGMIMDDNADFRPGLKARDEEGALSLLQSADFYKTDVRAVAAHQNLMNWNKVASCSVSSRFPYNTVLTEANLTRVMEAEKALRGRGFATVRVRVQDNLARIEVPKADMTALMEQMDAINSELKALGYEYVTLDLQGFKSGRMNDVLSADVKAALVG